MEKYKSIINHTELAVAVELAHFQAQLPVKPLLLVPQLEYLQIRIGVVSVKHLQISRQSRRGIAAGMVFKIDIERAAFQSERLFGVHREVQVEGRGAHNSGMDAATEVVKSLQ